MACPTRFERVASTIGGPAPVTRYGRASALPEGRPRSNRRMAIVSRGSAALGRPLFRGKAFFGVRRSTKGSEDHRGNSGWVVAMNFQSASAARRWGAACSVYAGLSRMRRSTMKLA